MRIFSLNCGSSSIKSALIDVGTGRHEFEARVENISAQNCRLIVQGAVQALDEGTSYDAAVQKLIDECERRFNGRPADAMAHRIVHGGSLFTGPVRVDAEVLKNLERLNDLAPLHNPPALRALRTAIKAMPRLPQVAVFDTSFHATLPAHAREYALPPQVRRRFGLRRFGFHGISHENLMRRTAEHLQRPSEELRLISCHLGSGASIAAIEFGRCIDTSMGMTPLEGLVMGTRAGDIDPGALLQLLRSQEFNALSLEEMLNSQSGLKGMTGTQDMKTIEQRAASGDEACREAIALYSYRLCKYIGAYAAVLGGVDAIAFTGGIGEHSALVRRLAVQRLSFLGVLLDEDRNNDAAVEIGIPSVEISDPSSRVKVLVVRADEESAMAEAADRLLRLSATSTRGVSIPVAVSSRHAHLSEPTLKQLFGDTFALHVHAPLSQTGHFSTEETVSLIGPRGRLDHVRLVGPPRADDQIEISRSDEFTLGVDAPVRTSGDLLNTPGLTLEGPRGRVVLKSGVICARRHVHMSEQDAQELGLRDHDIVAVKLGSRERSLIFEDVVVRVSPAFKLELHLDTDEANAAGVQQGESAELVTVPSGSEKRRSALD